MVKVAPSLLAADFTNLQKEIKKIEDSGATMLHYDVMDGHFVPNISFGYGILSSIRKITDLYLDVHLMLSHPQEYMDAFIQAGANAIVFHQEAVSDINEAKEIIAHVQAQNVEVGISIKPDTDVSVLAPFLDSIDIILVMSVEPGFGGQTFNSIAIDKIASLQASKIENGYHYTIEVDGGINQETAKPCKKAGVDVLVAGSSVFNRDNYKEAIEELL